jgi:polysaccharide export outer membrane protein
MTLKNLHRAPFAMLLATIGVQLACPFSAFSQEAPAAVEARPASAPPGASVSPDESVSHGEYVVGAQDVLEITVFGESDISGTFPVETDGTFNFPLIGRLRGAGLTLRAIERELQERLADGYLQQPMVSVAVGEFRSQRIFVVGEVGRPGAYPLTAQMTLIEALATAGSTSSDAAPHVAIVRGSGAESADEAVDPPAAAEVLQVDLGKFQAGALVEHVFLRDGDIVIVPRAQSIYVLGQVRNPGVYALERDATVLQALAQAGGVTDRGSMSRLRIVRVVNGKKTELKAEVDDPLQAGDMIMVLQRFF